MTLMLQFVAFGIPQPQGSAKAFIPKGWNRAIITSDNPKVKGWRQVVAEEASAALNRLPAYERTIATGPVVLTVTFYLPRPKSLGQRVAVPHVKRPDLDKLVRGVCDALKRVAWQDDSQVVDIQAQKVYAGPTETPRAFVEVRELP